MDIGIIGGADGPTAILISGSKQPKAALILAACVIVIGAALVIYFKYRKRKK